MRKQFIIIIFVLSIAFIKAEVNVTVEEINSNPQICVNGEPVRPRMFWGAERGGNVMATIEWREISFDVTAKFEANATWHLRFGKTPGDIWLTDVKIQNASTGRIVFPANTFKSEQSFYNSWNYYPEGANNTVGSFEFADMALHVILQNPPAGESWPDFHIYSDYITIPEGATFRFSCKVKADSDREIIPAVYHVKNGWTFIGGPSTVYQQQIEMAKNVGVDFITFNASNCWLENGEDWQALDYACEQVLDVNPNALLIPRISMDAPTWWKNKYPDQMMKFNDGSIGTQASISSRSYRRDASEHLKKLCTHLKAKFPENLAGIHPSGQNTGEWFYQETWNSLLSGYDDATAEVWQNYPEGAGVIPTFDERNSSTNSLLLNPTTQSNVIAFNQFLQDEMADFILELAAAARRGLGDNKLVMFFYGYNYEFGTVYNGPATSGHYGLEKILASDDIDILSAPVSYYDRDLLGSGPNMTSVESVTLANKFWLNEDDTRTYLSTNIEDHDRYGGPDTQAETKSVLMRNAAQSALRGYGTWWMDHGAGTGGGWFLDEELWQVLEEIRPLDEKIFYREAQYNPDIALIIDEYSLMHLAGGNTTVGHGLLYSSRKSFARSGLSYGQYLLKDDLNNDIEAKVKFYLATWALTTEQRQQLINQKKSDDVRVWCYAPGYIEKSGFDVDAMSLLTGFQCVLTQPNSGFVNPTDTGKNYGLYSSWGAESKINPLFTIDATDCIVLANYSNGNPAVAIKNTDNGTDVFVGIPYITTELVRVIGSLVHDFSDHVILWQDDEFLAFHGYENGNATFRLNNDNQEIRDLVSGEIFGNNSDIYLDVKAGETRILTWSDATDIDSQSNTLSEFRILGNYPNPFNPTTKIRYQIHENILVKVDVFDLTGKKVESLLNEKQVTGLHEIVWNAGDRASGIYFLRVIAGNYTLQHKMVLLK